MPAPVCLDQISQALTNDAELQAPGAHLLAPAREPAGQGSCRPFNGSLLLPEFQGASFSINPFKALQETGPLGPSVARVNSAHPPFQVPSAL